MLTCRELRAKRIYEKTHGFIFYYALQNCKRRLGIEGDYSWCIAVKQMKLDERLPVLHCAHFNKPALCSLNRTSVDVIQL